jgi:homoserine O-succinyltransferase
VPKLSGIYKHHILNKKSPLFRGFDDVYYAPHSRATEITREQILECPDLELMAESDEAGVGVVKSVDSRQFFVLYHSEYDADTLKLEYERDLAKGMDPIIPVNYFPDDDPTKEPIVNWRAAGQLLWTNWINYYVYQTTPYNINEVENE